MRWHQVVIKEKVVMRIPWNMCNPNIARVIRRKYISCVICNKQIPRTRSYKCNHCFNQYIGNQINYQNNNKGDNITNDQDEQTGSRASLLLHAMNNQQNSEMKNEGWIDS